MSFDDCSSKIGGCTLCPNYPCKNDSKEIDLSSIDLNYHNCNKIVCTKCHYENTKESILHIN